MDIFGLGVLSKLVELLGESISLSATRKSIGLRPIEHALPRRGGGKGGEKGGREKFIERDKHWV